MDELLREIKEWFIVCHGRAPHTVTEFADFAGGWVVSQIEEGVEDLDWVFRS